MSSGDRFCTSRKGGTGEVGECTQKVQTARPSLGSAKNTVVGSGQAIAVLLCMNGLRKQSSCLARCPFP